MVGKKLLNVLFYFFSLVFVIFITGFWIFYHYGKDLPSELTLLDYSPPTTTKIYSADNDLIEEYAIEHRVIVPFEKIPAIVKGAFMIAEDREFYRHSGLSFQSLSRAIIENTAKKSWNRKPAGGSTITQQVAKNLLVGNARSLSRKIKEAIMAFRIESSISKDKILEIYLNQLYLGKGCYGIVEACNYYFDKQLNEIEPQEAAFLAAIPSAPSVYINMKDSSKILTKRNSILYQMYELGYISRDQLKNSVSKPINIKLRKNKLSSPYFSDEIFRMFSQKISVEAFLRYGYTIKTTMDKKIQNCATKALEDGLIDFTKTKAWHGTLGKANGIKLSDLAKKIPTTVNKIIPCFITDVKKFSITCKDNAEKIFEISLSEKFYKDAHFEIDDVILIRELENGKYEIYQTPEATGGIVVMDPENGNVLGMSGGYSFDLSSFNCVTQALRQPGSTIKPFVYAAALESGIDEYDIIEDKPIHIKLSDGTTYSPHNYNEKCYGETYVRDGLIYSRNLTTVNLALKIGMPAICEMLKNSGLIEKKIPISGVLGASETTPLKMISAFSAFVNKGYMVQPKFITDIKQSNEKYLHDSVRNFLCETKKQKICSEKTADTIKNILHDAIKIGTGIKLAPLETIYGIQIIGKTGTTNNFKDAWFVGAVTKNEKTYLVCIFVGYQTPRSLGDHASGAHIALPIFEKFIKNYFSLE